jgi:hypothetical protein
VKYTRSALFSLLALAIMAGACSKRPTPAAAHGPQPAATPTTAGDPTLARSHAAEAPLAQPSSPSTATPTPIADVWANRKSLAGRTVTVQGKVVKYNGGILGRNWVHLQDGTGKADDHTNDLAVTTTDETTVGDTITVSGTVGIDRDFTAGYQYPVMIENARIVKKQ